MSKVKNSASQFPTLVKNQFESLDKTEIAPITDILGKNHYFTVGPDGYMIIANLFPYHFSSNLYDGVVEGSKRWWLLEKRKYDYEFIKANRLTVGSRKKLSHKMVTEALTGWDNKVISWYDDKYKTTGETKNKYSVKKTYSDNIILSRDEAVEIGCKDGAPVFYQITKIKDTDEVRIDVTPITTGNSKCNKFSERWWALERIKYDNGDHLHPVVDDEYEDWLGVIEKSYLCKMDDLIEWHEEGWRRWVNYCYSAVPGKTPRELDSDKENFLTISRLSDSELKDLANELPDYIVSHLPSTLYKKVLYYLINKVSPQVKISDRDKMKELKGLLQTVNETYKTGCKNITFEHAILALSNLSYIVYKPFISVILTNIDRYHLSPKSKKIMETYYSITIYDPKKKEGGDTEVFDNFCLSRGIDQYEFWSGNYFDEFMNSFLQKEKLAKDKFGLI